MFAVGLALALPSVVSLWYTIGTTIIPGLLVPVVAGYFEKLKIPPNYAFAAMLLGWLTSTGSLIFGIMNRESGAAAYWFGIEPMYPGLIASVLVWGAGRMRILSGVRQSRP